VLRELSVLKNIIHENLIEYIGAANEIGAINAVYICTEFAQGDDR